ncbi:MAG: GAF domain-containing protein [Planctomycetota bacterium]|jgi:GAF domain-containing protein
MKESSKERHYRTVRTQLSELVPTGTERVSAMATAAALLKARLPYFFWVGFYLAMDDGALGVGPYQGPVACLRLPPGEGVCGESASRKATVVVPDVHAHAGHIACDPRSRSEIVVPLIDREGRVRALLDVDSDRPNAFSDVDRSQLEAIAAHIVQSCEGV